MTKSELFPTLSEIVFAEKDPDTITQEVLSLYTSLTGRTLARGDPIRLFLDAIILLIIQQRNLIDFAAKQNLLAYATGDYLDHIGALLGVTRLEATSEDSSPESDENFRERIQIAPESFSVAGPKNAYTYWAMTANPDISDVAVVGPPVIAPGCVDIYPLMKNGELPSDEVMAQVMATCNRDDVRPDTDYVTVKCPISVAFNLRVKFWVDEAKASSALLLVDQVEAAVDAWLLWQRSKLGRDINPSELVHRMVEAGAKRVSIEQPEFQVLEDWEVGIAAETSIEYCGLEKG